MKIIKINEQLINYVSRISLLLRQNRILIIPTDTIYGLVWRVEDYFSTLRVFRAKKRPSFLPLILLVSGYRMLNEICVVDRQTFDKIKSISSWIRREYKRETTFILTRKKVFKANSYLNCQLRMGVRIIDKQIFNRWLVYLLNIIGPLFSTSVNRHGEKYLTRMDNLESSFFSCVDTIFDVGEISREPSIICDLENQVVNFRKGWK